MNASITLIAVGAFATAATVIVPRLLSSGPKPIQTTCHIVECNSSEGAKLQDAIDTVCSTGDCHQVAPAVNIVACLDTSGSVPKDFVELGSQWFARRVKGLVTGPWFGGRIYVRVLNADSYSPRSGLLAQTLPPVPLPPARPKLSENPFANGENARVLSGYYQAQAAWLDSFHIAQEAAASTADKIGRLNLPYTPYATDIAGCVIRAADLVKGATDRRILVVSDLNPQGPQSRSAMRLEGVKVIVAFWCDDQAAKCATRRQNFEQTVRKAGGPPVAFIDPQDLGL
jgi:hypothetical protein